MKVAQREYKTWKDGLDIAIQVCDDIERNTMAQIASYQASLDNKQAQTDYGIAIGAGKIRAVLKAIQLGQERPPPPGKGE